MSSAHLVTVAEQPKKNASKDKTIVITGGLTPLADFGPESQILMCPYCGHFVRTVVKPTAAVKTHLVATLLCMCCCWLCSCCPYLIDACMDRSHYCTHCRSYLGKYRF